MAPEHEAAARCKKGEHIMEKENKQYRKRKKKYERKKRVRRTKFFQNPSQSTPFPIQLYT